MGCFFIIYGLYCASMNTPTTPLIARLIRDNRTAVKDPNTNDPLTLVKTKEDLISFPSVNCTLCTNRLEDAKSGNCEFVILILNNNDEKHYVFQLTQSADGARKCICYESLTDWDKDAKLVRF